MARKIFGYYEDETSISIGDSDSRILQIGSNELVCLIKNASTGKITAFESYDWEKKTGNISVEFNEIKQLSGIFSGYCKTTICYFNCEQTTLIPQINYSTAAAADYLDLLYGESPESIVKVHFANNLAIAFRLEQNLHRALNELFPLYQPLPVYASLLKDPAHIVEKNSETITLQLYGYQFILMAMKGTALQMIQTFAYAHSEDIVYHLLNTVKQLDFSQDATSLTVSGRIDKDSPLHLQLKGLFNQVLMDELPADTILNQAPDHPAHYFTPYNKLLL
ncbi:MAG: hypothetical protein RLZZ28_146 [Bacteroidota bacterium]|jgi:hypothetical protein